MRRSLASHIVLDPGVEDSFRSPFSVRKPESTTPSRELTTVTKSTLRSPSRFRARESQDRKTTKPPNQALQTTSVTRSGFGKVPVSDRHRLGV